MIQGYRMEGPPPGGEPPRGPRQREWPVWLGFAGLGAAFLVSVFGQVLILAVSGTDTGEETPAWATLAASLVLQTTLIATALVAAALVKPVHPWQFGLRPTRFWPAVGWSLAGLAAFYAVAIVYVALLGEPEQSTAEDIGADESELALLAAGLLFVVVAPIAEEFFFRGFFYGALRTRLRATTAAIVCGLVFGGIHVTTGPEAVPILIVLGIIFCAVREKTGSLYPCIALHAVNNALAYAGQTDVHLGVALGLGAAMVAACMLVPRFAWRSPPSPA